MELLAGDLPYQSQLCSGSLLERGGGLTQGSVVGQSIIISTLDKFATKLKKIIMVKRRINK